NRGYGYGGAPYGYGGGPYGYGAPIAPPVAPAAAE
ncbi:MAG TPA: sulfur globule protein CV1, partial [Chromatiales bacterium]|nr:sulfur globule protein CV1 [Chromatiales bacterium]